MSKAKTTAPPSEPETLPYAVYTRRDEAPAHLRTLDSANLTVEQINELTRLAWDLREDRVIDDHMNEETGDIMTGGTVPVVDFARAREKFRDAFEVRGTLWVRLTDAELAERAARDGGVN